eukprot:6026243-Amphidinium_carterae.1
MTLPLNGSHAGNGNLLVQTKMITVLTPKAFIAAIYAVMIRNCHVIICVWTAFEIGLLLTLHLLDQRWSYKDLIGFQGRQGMSFCIVSKHPTACCLTQELFIVLVCYQLEKQLFQQDVRGHAGCQELIQGTSIWDVPTRTRSSEPDLSESGNLKPIRNYDLN